MTKQEIEKAIKNGDSVWVANKYCYPYEVNLTNNHYIDIADNKESLMLAHIDDIELIDYLEYIFETKDKAQHYHDHANVARTETLPFLTWEEFLESKEIIFTTKKYETVMLGILSNKLILVIRGKSLYNYWDLTEENFYKAYDECIRLFKGE